MLVIKVKLYIRNIIILVGACYYSLMKAVFVLNKFNNLFLIFEALKGL